MAIYVEYLQSIKFNKNKEIKCLMPVSKHIPIGLYKAKVGNM